MIKPLWVTIAASENIMAIERGGAMGKFEPFDEARIIQLVLDTRRAKPEWRFPDLPAEYQAGEDEQIFVGGLNWDGDPEDCQPDPDVIPFDARSMYYDDGIF